MSRKAGNERQGEGGPLKLTPFKVIWRHLWDLIQSTGDSSGTSFNHLETPQGPLSIMWRILRDLFQPTVEAHSSKEGGGGECTLTDTQGTSGMPICCKLLVMFGSTCQLESTTVLI